METFLGLCFISSWRDPMLTSASFTRFIFFHSCKSHVMRNFRAYAVKLLLFIHFFFMSKQMLTLMLTNKLIYLWHAILNWRGGLAHSAVPIRWFSSPMRHNLHCSRVNAFVKRTRIISLHYKTCLVVDQRLIYKLN